MSREKDYASAHNLANQNKQKYDQEQADRHQVALGVKYGFVKPEHADKTPQELLAIKYGFDKPEIEETKDTTVAQRYQKSKDKNPDKLVTSVGNPSASVGEGLLLNYSKDVAWIQEKLLNLGILSDASYAAEKATGDDYIGSDAIPQTIKAIITYQKEVLAYGSTDGQVTAGGNMETSIGLANLDTVNKKREEYKKGLEAKEKAEKEEEFILKIKNTPSTNEAVGDFFNNASLVSVPYLVHDLAPYMNHNPEFFKAVLNHAKFTDTNAYDLVNHLNDAQLNGFSNDIKSQLKSKLTNGLGFALNAEYQEQVGRIVNKEDGELNTKEGKTEKISSTPWMDIAKSQLGTQEATDNNDGEKVEEYLESTGLGKGNPWCGAFVNWCLEASGIDGVKPTKTNHPARALSWRDFGEVLSEPAYGAIATKKRKGGGHVAFVAGKTKEGKIVMLGGNQNDEVNYTPYSKSVLKFNYPKWGKVNKSLPIINIKTVKIKEN